MLEDCTEPLYDFELQMSADFDLTKAVGDEPEKRMVRGFGSTEDEDQQGESVLQNGLDISYLKKSGYINYDHQKMRDLSGATVPIIIGYPEVVDFRKSRSGATGLWCEGRLLDGDPSASEQIRLANEMWHLGSALQKSGGSRRLAYSVEGKVDERRGKKIVKARVFHMALTHKPVNPTCSVEVFAKSLCCGKCSPDHPLYDPMHSCHNKIAPDELDTGAFVKALDTALSTEATPLMKENLDRGITSALGFGTTCGCFDPETKRIKGGSEGLYNHLTKCLNRDPGEAKKLVGTLERRAGVHKWASALANKTGITRS